MDDFGIETSKFKPNTKSGSPGQPIVKKPLENMNASAQRHIKLLTVCFESPWTKTQVHNGNREWEVGVINNYYEDIDDGKRPRSDKQT